MAFTVYVPADIPADEALRMQRLRESGLLHVGDVPAIQNIVWAAAFCTGQPMVAISIIDGNLQRLVATVGFEAAVTSRATSFCAHAINTPDAIFCVPDALEDARFAGNPAVLEDPRIRFYAAAPLVMSDGRAGGALCVLGASPRPCLSAGEEAELRHLAQQVVKLAGAHEPPGLKGGPGVDRKRGDGRVADLVRTAGLEPALSSRSGF